MDNQFYNSYQSAEWQRKKNAVLERDGYTCQICGEHKGLMQVHHITYKNCKGFAFNSPLGDLITLCQDCHAADDGDHKHFFEGSFTIVERGFFGNPYVINNRELRIHKPSKFRWEFNGYVLASLDGVFNVGGRAIGFRTNQITDGIDGEWAWFPVLSNIKYHNYVWVEDEWCADSFQDQRLATIDEVIELASLVKFPCFHSCIERKGDAFTINEEKFDYFNYGRNNLKF